jgi:hypothetical protein
MALLAFFYFTTGGGRSAEQKFYDDAEANGVPTSKSMVTLGTHETVADVICRYARDGKDPLTFTEVFNRFGDSTAFNPNEAKVTAYWAITDVCPDQSSKVDASWRDAVRRSGG